MGRSLCEDTAATGLRGYRSLWTRILGAAHEDRGRSRTMIPRSSDGLAHWAGLFGNHAVQSLLAPRSTGPKSCSCGGTCSSCSKEEETYPGSDFWQRVGCSTRRETVALLHAMSRPPGEETEEPDEQLLPGSCGRGASSLIEERLGEQPEPGPHAVSATIVCNGSGGYRTKLAGSWVDEGNWNKCGVWMCVEQHEQSHVKDWEKRFPDGCKNADGTFKKDGTPVPTGGEGYDDFLRQSECQAYKIELACEQKLQETASKDCKPDMDTIVKDRQERVKNCGGGC